MTRTMQIAAWLAMTACCAIAASTVPFTDGFEGYTNGATFLIETNGWQANTNTVVVQTNTVSGGTNAVDIAPEGVLSNMVSGSGITRLWTDQYLQPNQGSAPTGAVDSAASLRLYFTDAGYVAVATNGSWDVCSNDVFGASVTPVGSGWARLAFHHDFVASNVAVVLGNQVLRQEVPFIGSATAYSQLRYDNTTDGGSGTNTYLDDVAITTNLPSTLATTGDGDNDGVRDVKEIHLYGSTTNAGGSTLTAQTLPFVDDFEFYVDGARVDYLGYYGWDASDSNAVIQSSTVYSNAQAARIGGMSAASNSINPAASETNIWFDWYVKPALGPEPGSPDSDASLHLYFSTNGFICVATNGAWEECSTDAFGTGAVPVSNQWVRLTLFQDYTASNAAVFLDGRLIRQEIPFIGSVSSLGGVTYRNQHVSSNSFVDTVEITTNLTELAGLTTDPDGDGDDDGMPDAEEIDIYGTTTNYGLPQITVIITNLYATGPGGTVTPDGIFTVASGSDTNFTMTVTNLAWRLTDVRTNDVAATFTGDNSTNGTFALSNITEDVTVTVEFTYTPGLAVVTQSLPFVDHFEAYTNGWPMDELGFYGWDADTNTAVVQSATKNAGSYGAEIAGDSAASNIVSTTALETNIWFDWYLRPPLGVEPDSADTDASLHVFFDTNGYVNVATNGGWAVCSNDVIGVPVTPVSNQFVRLTLFQDYVASNAAVLLGGRVIRQEIPFVGSASSFSGITYRNLNTSSNGYLDDVIISTNLNDLGALPLDADGDGMPDAEEIDLYGNTTNFQLNVISIGITNVNGTGPGGTTDPSGPSFQLSTGQSTTVVMTAYSLWLVTDVKTNDVAATFTGDNTSTGTLNLVNVSGDIDVLVEFSYTVDHPLTAQTLPFIDPFEDYTNGWRMDELGFYGWDASTNTAIVQDTTNHAGTLGAKIAAGGAASNLLTTTAAETNIWFDWYLLPPLGTEPDSIDTDASLHLFFNSNGYITVANDGSWDACDEDVFCTAATPVSNQWVRLTLFQDYTASNAAVLLDGRVMRQLVPFAGTSVSSLSGVTYRNLATNAHGYLDDVIITTNFADLASFTVDDDGDGMIDAEEIDTYGSVNAWPTPGALFLFR